MMLSIFTMLKSFTSTFKGKELFILACIVVLPILLKWVYENLKEIQVEVD